MILHYHTCGQPIDVWRGGFPSDADVYYDGTTSWADRPIHTCPRCGQRLGPDSLLLTQPHVSATLFTWLRAWPQLRADLEKLLVAEQNVRSAAVRTRAEHDLVCAAHAVARLYRLACTLEEDQASVPIDGLHPATTEATDVVAPLVEGAVVPE